MSIVSTKRRLRILLLGGSSFGMICLVTLGVAGVGARAATNSPGVSTQAASQVSWLCTSAKEQHQAGTASKFLVWVDQKCNAEGAGNLAASARNNSAAIGALICQYATAQAQAGAASSMDRIQAQLCRVKPLPSESGIVSQPSAPPSGSNMTPTNAWAGVIGGQRELVYAGAQSQILNDGSPGNPQQGLILVVNEDTNTYKTIPSSGLDGALTIVSVRSSSLSLSAANGSTYSFDLNSDALTRIA